jgi:anion-transporting  ArsA/GET3 family ATPase
MAFILTFLGKGGVGRTTIAIAAAKKFASQGKRVLLASQDAGPAFGLLLGAAVGSDPQAIAPNLQAMQFQTTVLMERSWDDLKKLEAQYLRTPFFKAVFGQELGIMPGMDTALALNALREYDSQYDVIVYDGTGNQETLRMLGMPEILSWYLRRFRQVFAESDLGKTLSPFIQPVAAAVLNVSWTGSDIFNQPSTQQANNMLEQGRQAVANPSRVAAYLVTSDDAAAIATAQYLWGSAQQVGLTVGGVIVNRAEAAIGAAFEPLSVAALPTATQDWDALIAALPDFDQVMQAPRAMTIDVAARQVTLFLPNFDKKQVKLIQSGPEITIEAGDQRHNIALPPELSGKPVTGAKFQNGSLIISF